MSLACNVASIFLTITLLLLTLLFSLFSDNPQEAGLVVKDVVVLIDREQGGEAHLKSQGLTLHSAFKLSALLSILVKHGLVQPETASAVHEFIAANQTNVAAPAVVAVPVKAKRWVGWKGRGYCARDVDWIQTLHTNLSRTSGGEAQYHLPALMFADLVQVRMVWCADPLWHMQSYLCFTLAQ